MWDLRETPIKATDWAPLLQNFMKSSAGLQLTDRLIAEADLYTIFPSPQNVFRALDLTPREQVRVVILGQDPYHGIGQADGLAFSVPRGVSPPPSLRNILRELRDDLGVSLPIGFELTHWATQGVLLLNTTLTVRQDQAGSHRGFGWEELTDSLIQTINEVGRSVVFVLWGKDAQCKLPKIDTRRHLAICSPHPSPLSAHRGFFGSRPFSRINRYLAEHAHPPITWH